MMGEKTPPEVELLDLSHVLREKVGPGDGHLDLEAIARAEAALESLQDEWQDWLNDDVALLLSAQSRLHEEGFSPEISDALLRAAHDLKGLAPTYQFPLVGRIAAGLCTALLQAAETGSLPVAVVDAHVDAIRAAIREDVRECDHPVGVAITAALDDLVRKRMG